MIVNNSIQYGVTGVYASQQASAKKTSEGATAAVTSKDEIVLSRQAQSFSTSLKELQDTSSDIRSDKVTFYENQIAAGTYNIDVQALAEQMLQMRY